MNHCLIAGLGNPGDKYQKTRHNVGWMVLDSLAQDRNWEWRKSGNSMYAREDRDGSTFHILKPLEYMNLSGKEISRISNLYKIPATNILIVHDELDLPFGTIRRKVGGGTAGHNGLKDIVEKLGTSDFHRVRFGIGKPDKSILPVSEYVLQNFTKEEEEKLIELLKESKLRIVEWIQEKAQTAKNSEKKG